MFIADAEIKITALCRSAMFCRPKMGLARSNKVIRSYKHGNRGDIVTGVVQDIKATPTEILVELRFMPER
jgi:hypothetical protein